MHILFLTASRMPTERAMGQAISKMCEAFADIPNVKVTLLTPKRKNSLTQNVFDYYNVNENFEIIYIPCMDLDFLGNSRLKHMLIYLSYIFNLKNYINKDTVVYTREPELFYFLNKKIKMVLEVHHFNGLYNFLGKRVLNKVYKIIALTDGVKNNLIENLKVEAKKILVKGSGIDLHNFEINKNRDDIKKEAREKLGLEHVNLPIAMYIGSLEKWKGYETFLQASELLKNKVQFVVIGGYEYEMQKLENLKTQFPQVIFLGQKPQSELGLNQQAADILVVPNTAQDEISAKYTSPLKVLTHMASGIPILASDLPSTRELLDNTTATFFQPDNIQNLADQILYILGNYSTFKTKAEQAKKQVVKYDWSLRVKEILDFIK